MKVSLTKVFETKNTYDEIVRRLGNVTPDDYVRYYAHIGAKLVGKDEEPKDDEVVLKIIFEGSKAALEYIKKGE